MMKGNKHMRTETNITYHAFALFAVACFVLSPQVQAVDPPPDGGYANENTAEGDSALFSLTDGPGNTAIGYRAMYNATLASDNTAVGDQALSAASGGTINTAVGYQALL